MASASWHTVIQVKLPLHMHIFPEKPALDFSPQTL